MWPFRKKPSPADAAIAVFPDAIEFAAEKWLYLNSIVVYKEGVPLLDRIVSFMIPAEQGLANNFPPLRNAPDGITLMIVAMGIWKSGTHTREQIEDALGVQLPEMPRPK